MRMRDAPRLQRVGHVMTHGKVRLVSSQGMPSKHIQANEVRGRLMFRKEVTIIEENQVPIELKR